MLVDTLGRPLRFIVTAGQVGDITQAPALLQGQSGNALSPFRNAIRPQDNTLRRLHLPHRSYDLAAMNVDST